MAIPALVKQPKRRAGRRRVQGIPPHWFKWLAIAVGYALLCDFGIIDGFLFADSGHGHGEDAGGGHGGPVINVLMGIVVILFLAKIGGDLFERISLPAVLGELTIGVVIGNWVFLGNGIGAMFGLVPVDLFGFLNPDQSTAGEVLKILSEIGVVLLLFEVGLECRVGDMVKVGGSAAVVAILGVVAPIVLGFGVSALILERTLLPADNWQVPLFIGATLCATSVGITARVLKDLGKSQLKESRIILGAAVIDDVLGLIVLAVVSGVIAKGAEFESIDVLWIVLKAFGFLAGAMILGAVKFPKMLFILASKLRGHGLLVTTALVICFGFSVGADAVGLAPIIGAFAAGLILERAQFEEEGHMHELEEAVQPLSALLVPIFFVEMGMQVGLESFASSSVWLLAISITVMAVIGKQVCSLGVREKGLNKLAVGIGMIPRGEVGLIFAGVGSKLKGSDGKALIAGDTYSAIVVMVMITTMVTPPALKWVLAGTGSDDDPESAGEAGGVPVEKHMHAVETDPDEVASQND